MALTRKAERITIYMDVDSGAINGLEIQVRERAPVPNAAPGGVDRTMDRSRSKLFTRGDVKNNPDLADIKTSVVALVNDVKARLDTDDPVA